MNLTLRIGSVILSIILAVVLQASGFGQEHPASHTLAKTSGEKAIMDVLNKMVANQETYLSVPEQDGRALRLLTEAVGAHRVLEIGTSTGYSGLWFSMALQATGGHLTTLELDHGRATQARQHFEKAGVSSLVTVIEGDAREQVTKLKGPFDVAFIDAEKPGYMDYLHKVLPLVRPGGLIFAHNVDMVPDYVKAITSNPDLETIFYMEGKGLAITLKKP
jgi:predicted O-methyltransferase YrrM